MMIYGADSWFLLCLWNKEATAQRMLEEVQTGKSHLVIPYPAVAETTKKLMQQGNPAERISTFWSMLESSKKIRFVPLEKTIAVEGARVSMTHGVPLMDALIAATAKLTGCHALFSSDSDMAVLAKKIYVTVKSW